MEMSLHLVSDALHNEYMMDDVPIEEQQYDENMWRLKVKMIRDIHENTVKALSKRIKESDETVTLLRNALAQYQQQQQMRERGDDTLEFSKNDDVIDINIIIELEKLKMRLNEQLTMNHQQLMESNAREQKLRLKLDLEKSNATIARENEILMRQKCFAVELRENELRKQCDSLEHQLIASLEREVLLQNELKEAKKINISNDSSYNYSNEDDSLSTKSEAYKSMIVKQQERIFIEQSRRKNAEDLILQMKTKISHLEVENETLIAENEQLQMETQILKQERTEIDMKMVEMKKVIDHHMNITIPNLKKEIESFKQKEKSLEMSRSTADECEKLRNTCSALENEIAVKEKLMSYMMPIDQHYQSIDKMLKICETTKDMMQQFDIIQGIYSSKLSTKRVPISQIIDFKKIKINNLDDKINSEANENIIRLEEETRQYLTQMKSMKDKLIEEACYGVTQ